MVLRDHPPRDRGRVEGNAGRVDEGLERRRGVRPPDTAAADDQGPLGPGEQGDGGRDRRRVALRAGRRLGAGRERDTRLLHGLAQDVAREVEIDGARPARRRRSEGGGHELGDAPGLEHALGPLRDRTHDRDLIDLLERLHPKIDARARPAHRDQRGGVDEGVGDARHEIGRPRSRAAHTDAGAPGHAAVRVGHHRRRLLVACVDGPDPEPDAGAFGLEHRPAHEEEERVHALRGERSREELRPSQ